MGFRTFTPTYVHGMKRVGGFFISFVFLCFVTACSSDDEGPNMADASAIIGTWNLTEVNINIAQDVDQDGIFSTNLVDELPCLTGVLNINANGTWTGTVTSLGISPVTGDFFAVRCSGSSALGGNWTFAGNELNLQSFAIGTLLLQSGTLREEVGQDLPGIRSKVFEKP